MLDITQALLTEITEDLGQDGLEDSIGHIDARRSVSMMNGVKPYISNIKGGAEAVTTLLTGISVYTAQAVHIILSTQDTGYYNPVCRHILNIQTVNKISANLLQKVSGLRYQVGNTLAHGPVNAEIRIGSHIHQFLFAVLGLIPVLHGSDTITASRDNLHFLQIRETLFIGMNAPDTMTPAARLFGSRFGFCH